MAHYGMAIDLARCIACHGCTLACKTANNLPDGVRYTNVLTDGGQYMDTARGTYPNDLHRVYYPVGCQHCENPACVKVCPVGATYKDPETGVVRQDSDKCIGCRMCMSACPYTGVRSFNWEEPCEGRNARLHGGVRRLRPPLGRLGRSGFGDKPAHSVARIHAAFA